MKARIASDVLKYCLQLFKDAFPKNSIYETDIEEVELEIVQLDNPLEIINNRNRFYTYAFFLLDTDVTYIFLGASKFRRVLNTIIGFFQDCMIFYSRDEREKAMLLTKKCAARWYRRRGSEIGNFIKFLKWSLYTAFLS